MYLVGSGVHDRIEALRAESPALWRRVRRFNVPVQLAVAAALGVAEGARSDGAPSLISLAPCQAGSPELIASLRRLAEMRRRDATQQEPLRVNPTHTLHAVDNLALSAVSIALEARGYGIGLGGAAGQAWEALRLAAERLDLGDEEVLLLAGDQESSEDGRDPVGVALLLRGHPPEGVAGRSIRIVEVERHDSEGPHTSRPHAAAGLRRLLEWLDGCSPGRHRYLVPEADGDGIDRITVQVEVR